MRSNQRLWTWLLLATILLSALGLAAGDKKKKKSREQANAAAMQMDEPKRAIHMLNRFTFGPRPGELEQIQGMGIDKWFEQQLNPDKINDSALESRLAPFRTLKMSTEEIVRNFPPPQVIKQVANGRLSMPRDPQEKAIYQAAVDRQRQKQAVKQEAAENPNSADPNMQPADPGKAKRPNRNLEDRMYTALSLDGLMSEPPEQRFKDLM